MRKLRAKKFAFQWFIRPWTNGLTSIGLNDLWQHVWQHFSSKKYIKEKRSFLFYIVKYSFAIIYLRCLIWIQFVRFVRFSLFLAYRILNSHGFYHCMTARSDRGEHWRIQCKNRGQFHFLKLTTILTKTTLPNIL